MDIIIRDETLTLLPEKALFWRKENALMLADLHLAKSGHFRKSGVALPTAIHEHDLQSLSSLVLKCKANKLYLLGDLFHSTLNEEWKLFTRWRIRFPQLQITLVQGNHDLYDAAVMNEYGIDRVVEELDKPPFCLMHHARVKRNRYTIGGHLHPAIRLKGKARQSMSFPCFWFSAELGVLPAFGNFTGHVCITPSSHDHVFFIFNDQVKEFNR